MTGGAAVGEAPAATRLLASMVSGTDFADLSSVVVSEAKAHIMDCLGVGLAASGEEPGRVILGLLDDLGGGGRTRILGSPQTASVWDAAWANGCLCHLLDFDDTHGHATSCILPAALAAGDMAGVSGKELITATVAGWEVFYRLQRAGQAAEPLMRRRGTHPTAVYGPPGAAAAAAKIFDLSPDQTAIAIGLAASSSSGLTQQFGTWGKGVHAGNAARAGVIAAVLAQRDYYGASNVLEGPYGFGSALLGDDLCDWSGLADDLGTSWALENPGLSIKQYPACGGTQRAIAAALAVREEIVDDPARIASIEVRAPAALFDALQVDTPERGFQGKFSLRFCVAAALVDGVVDVGTFTDDSLHRPILQETMRKVRISISSPGGGPRAHERVHTPVKVAMQGGSWSERQVDIPRGNTKNPMTEQEIAAKYRRCASRVLPPAAVERSVELLRRLEWIRLEDVLGCLTTTREQVPRKVTEPDD
jgi:2-methylcitrate dehydratase PrpD